MNVKKYIYSYSTARKMLGLSNQLAKFLQSNYPELKWVKDITTEHIQAFINAHEKNWSRITIKNLKAEIHKLQIILNNIYFTHLDFSKVIYPEKEVERIKDHPMSIEDFLMVAESCLKRRSNARFVPILTYILGTRTEEVNSIKPEDIDLEARRVHLTNCKGGRKRSVPIRREFLEIMTFLKNYFVENNWKTVTNNIKHRSVIRFFLRLKKDLEIGEKYYMETNHAIRKLYARRRFKEEYERTQNKELSWTIVQKELGHGNQIRGELFRSYIGYNYKDFDPENEEVEFMQDTYLTFTVENDAIVIKKKTDETT